MCDCITEVDKSLATAGHNTRVGVTMPYKQVNGRMILSIRASVESVKADPSNRKKPTGIMSTYCPFCGEKYQTAEEQAAEAELLERFPMRESGQYSFYCRTCGGYNGMASATHGPAVGLAFCCGQQEAQGNEVRFEEVQNWDRECECGKSDEDEDESEVAK